MESNKCSIGIFTSEECSEGQLIDCNDFSEEDRITLNARSGTVVSLICYKHDKRFRKEFIFNEKVCADPYNIHDTKSRKSLRIITFECYNRFKAIVPSIAPGRKLCISCMKKIRSESVDQGVIESKTTDYTVSPNKSDDENLPRDSACNLSEPVITPDQEKTPACSQTSLLIQDKMSSNLSEKLQLSNLSTSTSEIYSSTSESCTPNEMLFDRLNTVAKMFKLSPIKKKDLIRSKTYAQHKYNDIKSNLQKCFEQVMDNNFDTASYDNLISDDNPELTGKEIIVQLKNKFENTSKLNEKLQILSVLPLNWSTEKIVSIFGATKYMIKKVKQRVKENGILFIPEQNKGHSLLKTTQDKIREFYRNQDVSRELPGKKEYKSVHENGQRVQKQKRLILGNLNEIYHLFKDKYPFEKVGFSKFASLRPPECVLAGASGTHVVCVCQIHENFKLLFHGAKLGKLKLNNDENQPFVSHRDCMDTVICQPPTNKCYFGECRDCPGSANLRTILENLFMDNFLDEITYNQWTQIDRCSLETIIKPADDFVDIFVEYIPKLLHHDFVAKKQAEYFQTTKNNLEIGEVLVVADFSENYSFLLQNSVQGAYWNNKQATIHPFACYYRSTEENKNEIVPLNLVITSDNLTHNTTAVYSFQEVLISFLKNKIPDISKIIYFSDGAASQYKNRYNLVNLLYHEEDFQIKAEWHYFATSHGKGPSDGLGGLIKRLISRANLQLPPDKQIQTPEQLHRWAKDNIQGINCHFVSDKQIRKTEIKLSKRFKHALPVQGIRGCHAAVPTSNEVLRVKRLSSFTEGENFRLKNLDVYEFVEEPAIQTR